MRLNRRFWSRAFLGWVTFGVSVQLIPHYFWGRFSSVWFAL